MAPAQSRLSNPDPPNVDTRTCHQHQQHQNGQHQQHQHPHQDHTHDHHHAPHTCEHAKNVKVRSCNSPSVTDGEREVVCSTVSDDEDHLKHNNQYEHVHLLDNGQHGLHDEFDHDPESCSCCWMLTGSCLICGVLGVLSFLACASGVCEHSKNDPLSKKTNHKCPQLKPLTDNEWHGFIKAMETMESIQKKKGKGIALSSQGKGSSASSLSLLDKEKDQANSWENAFENSLLGKLDSGLDEGSEWWTGEVEPAEWRNGVKRYDPDDDKSVISDDSEKEREAKCPGCEQKELAQRVAITLVEGLKNNSFGSILDQQLVPHMAKHKTDQKKQLKAAKKTQTQQTVELAKYIKEQRLYIDEEKETKEVAELEKKIEDSNVVLQKLQKEIDDVDVFLKEIKEQKKNDALNEEKQMQVKRAKTLLDPIFKSKLAAEIHNTVWSCIVVEVGDDKIIEFESPVLLNYERLMVEAPLYTPKYNHNQYGPKIPLTIITGELGAGKTTFINKSLNTKQLRLAVIENEFSTVSIDSSLLEGDQDDENDIDYTPAPGTDLKAVAKAKAAAANKASAKGHVSVKGISGNCLCCVEGRKMDEALYQFLVYPDGEMFKDGSFNSAVIELSGAASPKKIIDELNFPTLESGAWISREDNIKLIKQEHIVSENRKKNGEEVQKKFGKQWKMALERVIRMRMRMDSTIGVVGADV